MQALRLINTAEMSRDEWLLWRRQGISGSDIGAICGIDPWKSPMSVYLDKIGELPEQEDNDKMMFGRMYESVIADIFRERSGLKIERRNAILQHPEIPWALANVDRLVIDKKKGNGVLEVKTASVYAKKDWESSQIPERYMLQIQWYFFVTGLKYGYFAVECGHQYYQHYIERDDELIKLVFNQFTLPFWELVQKRQPPAMDGSESSGELLKKMYPEGKKDAQIILPDTAAVLINEYDTAAQEEKAAAERKEAAANQLKLMLGTAEKGLFQERKVIWGTVASSRLDTKRLKAEQPDIYKKYANESKSRRFTIA